MPVMMVSVSDSSWWYKAGIPRCWGSFL